MSHSRIKACSVSARSARSLGQPGPSSRSYNSGNADRTVSQPPTHQPGAHELDRVMAGIRHDRASQPKARKRAASADVLEAMLEAIPGGNLRAVRDRAVLAIGMAGALHRSELVAIQREHLTLDRRGIVLEIPVSKTDLEGKGHTIAIPRKGGIDAVGNLERWLDVAQIASGPVFRKLTPQGRLGRTAMSAQSVALIVKAAVTRRRARPDKPRDTTV